VIPRQAFVCPEIALAGMKAAESLALLEELDRQRRTHLFEIPAELYAKVAVRENSGGILLVVPYLTRKLDDLPRVPHPLYAIIEGVEKPGNLGAILRTADAAGVTGVIVSAGATDIHNPNVLRASLGAFFTVPICESPPVETIAWLQHNRVQIVAATPEADILYTQTNLRYATAIVLGSEAFGLSESLPLCRQRTGAHPHARRCRQFESCDFRRPATIRSSCDREVTLRQFEPRLLHPARIPAYCHHVNTLAPAAGG
jgi:TrmH family RNA methyltransferase